MDDEKEYRQFGPYMHEIGTESDIPRLFCGYYHQDEVPVMMFKIPRRIDKRDARPGMDLYDYLIGAYGDHLQLLKRVGRNVAEKCVYYSDIIAVRDVHMLLKGQLILYTPSGPSMIVYNTISREIIAKLIRVISAKIGGGARSIPMESLAPQYVPYDPGSLDMLFFNLVNAMQAENPDIRLLAHQPTPKARKTFELKSRLKSVGMLYSRTAFAVSSRELIILEREVTGRKSDTASYDYSYLYIPFQYITGAALDDFEGGQPLKSIRIWAKNLMFSYLLDSGNARLHDLYYALRDFTAYQEQVS